jgi:hypothetical protein
MTPDAEFHQRDRDLHPPAYTPAYKTSALRSPRIPRGAWNPMVYTGAATTCVFARQGRSKMSSGSERTASESPSGFGQLVIAALQMSYFWTNILMIEKDETR